jgi:ACS family tartrate transporter-like MFS transporter
MLLLEGAPSVILGIALLWLLPDGPAKAKWLTPHEKDVVAQRLAAEPPGALHGFKEMLLDIRIWVLMIPDFSIVIALYGVGLWMPQMISAMGFTHLETGFLVALPYILAMAAMVLLGLSSDRCNERVLHVAGAALAGAAGVVGAVMTTNPAITIACFCLAMAGIYAALAVFWTLPTAILRGTAAAGGLALLNSFSNLGGFFGPTVMGWARQTTGNFTLGMELLAGMLVVAAVSVVLIGRAFFSRSGVA